MSKDGARLRLVSMRESQALRDEANVLLGRYHGTTLAVAAMDYELETLAFNPGFPESITIGGYLGDELVGVATAWIPVHAENVARAYGAERATRWIQRWRVFSHLAVHEDHRGQGIGRTLALELEQQALASGARGFHGFAEHLPEPSWPFYERLGYILTPDGVPVIAGGIETMSPPGLRAGMNFVKLLPGAGAVRRRPARGAAGQVSEQ